MSEKLPSFSIKNWSQDDRPREKLRDKGKAALSDAELVAILIGSGSRNESAVELCKRILASVDNNLSALGKLSLKQLIEFKGIGEAKALTILAALELGRRRRGEEALQQDKIDSILGPDASPFVASLSYNNYNFDGFNYTSSAIQWESIYFIKSYSVIANCTYANQINNYNVPAQIPLYYPGFDDRGLINFASIGLRDNYPPLILYFLRLKRF